MPTVEIPRRVLDCLQFVKVNYEKTLNWWTPSKGYPTPVYISWSTPNSQHVDTAFALQDTIHWDDQQIIRQTLAVMGRLNELEEKEHKMVNRTSAEEAEKLGREVADALVPFLRMDYPPGAPLILGMVFSKWAGLERDASFMMGFAKVFEEYRSANKVLEEPRHARTTRLTTEED